MNLQKVKERVSKYKEEIDEAEERELTAKTALIDVEAEVEKTLGEVDGLKRRFVLLQKDLDGTTERVTKNEQRLSTAEGRYVDDDTARQEFEASEMERDEQLISLEEECGNAKKLKDEAHAVLVESERKLAVVDSELQRANERMETSVGHVERLEGNINDVADKIRELEESDYAAAEREQLSAEKLDFLNEQLRLVIETYESSERNMRKLEDLNATYHHEISTWETKTEIVRSECKKIEDLADEQLDEHPTERPGISRKYEPERAAEPEPEPEVESEPEVEPEPEPEPEPESEEEEDD